MLLTGSLDSSQYNISPNTNTLTFKIMDKCKQHTNTYECSRQWTQCLTSLQVFVPVYSCLAWIESIPFPRTRPHLHPQENYNNKHLLCIYFGNTSKIVVLTKFFHSINLKNLFFRTMRSYFPHNCSKIKSTAHTCDFITFMIVINLNINLTLHRKVICGLPSTTCKWISAKCYISVLIISMYDGL